jgi:hypothetical protein
MRRGALPLAVAVVILLAGCAAPTAPPDGGGSPAATPTDGSPPATETPPPATTAPGEVGVEYVVRAGTVPDAFQSVTVTLQVVFVEEPGDMGPCWRETFSGPYEPTPTPIAMPEGDCYRSETVTVDLAALDGDRSLGRITAPGSYDVGHALVATNVTATDRNGSAVGGIRGATGKRVAVVEGEPAGRYRVTLSVESYADRPYDYWFVAEETERTG